MTEKEELEFIKKWLACLHELNPGFRQPINAITIKLTGKFIGIDNTGTVEVCRVERNSKDEQ